MSYRVDGEPLLRDLLEDLQRYNTLVDALMREGNWAQSALSAETIQIMNDTPLTAQRHLRDKGLDMSDPDLSKRITTSADFQIHPTHTPLPAPERMALKRDRRKGLDQ